MGKYGKTITDAYQEVLEWTVTAHELQEKKKVTKREIKDLENDNEHGMVALKLAQSFGTPKEVKKIQDINKKHQRAGEIESKDQKERDAIARKYYNMAEEKLDEGKMKDIVTDVKDALGKIRHRVSQKGSKFIVSVDSNDEEDAQKAMKNHPLYVAGKLRVIPEETELDEKFKVGDKVKVKKGTMGPTQRHYEKTVGTIIKDYKDGDFKVNFGGYDNLGIDGKLLVKEETELDEGKFYLFDNEKDARDYAKKIKGKYVKGTGKSAGQHAVVKEEVELDEAKFQINYSKNNKLYSKTINAKDEDDAEEKAIKKFKIDDDDIRSVVKEALDEMFDYVLLDKDNKIVGRYSGKDAKKNAESGKKSAHLPPMRIPKGEVSKMKVYPISPKDKKGIGDMVLAIGEEKKLTDAEMKKREEIAKAIEKDNPNMPMDKKMAIATATAKRVAEEEEPKEPEKPDTAKKVDQMRDDKKKTRIAQLQLQIAKATETINKLNAQEK